MRDRNKEKASACRGSLQQIGKLLDLSEEGRQKGKAGKY